MNNSATLSAHTIIWSVIVRNSTKQAIFKLGKTDRAKYGTTVYHITDKQFSLIKNSFNGTLPNVDFGNVLHVKQDGINSAIPITQKQFDNALTYSK